MSRIVADRERCASSGMCALTAPEHFGQDDADGRVVVLEPEAGADDDAVSSAVWLCPAAALRLEHRPGGHPGTGVAARPVSRRRRAWRGPAEPHSGVPPASPGYVRGVGTRVDVAQHRNDVERLLAELAPAGEVVSVGEAAGRVLAADVVAPGPLPRFRNSQMDGFAVRAADVARATPGSPVALPVTGEVAAGPVRPAPLAAGTAVRIMTGAPVPDGADAIVPVEDTDLGTFNATTGAEALPRHLGATSGPGAPPRGSGATPGRASEPGGAPREPAGWGDVRIGRARVTGEFVREAGSDVGAGDLVLAAGTVLAPHHVAAAAACGVGELPVRRRVRVAIVSTGTELVAPGEPAGPGQIWDANAVALAAAVRAAGAEVAGTHRITDDPGAAAGTLRVAAASSDLVITSGGVSQGAHEVVKDVLTDVTFRPVAMQPGGPQGFGSLDGTPVVTFPGNPVSTQVSFVVFLRDPLRRAAGLPPIAPRRAVVAAGSLPDGGAGSPPGKRQFLRGRLLAPTTEGVAGEVVPRRTDDAAEPAVPRHTGGAEATTPADAGAPRRTGGTHAVSPGNVASLRALTVEVVGGAGSHLVASMAAADVLIDVPAEVIALHDGDEVTLLPL